MLRCRSVLALTLWALLPLGAPALNFEYSHSFDAIAYGPDGTGLPRGLAFRHFEIFIADAGDDRIYSASDAQPHAELESWNTNPLTCQLSAVPLACQPSTETALDVWDVAWVDWTEESIWIVDRSPGGTTALYELTNDAAMLRRIDIDAISTTPDGLGFDWRDGHLMLTDSGTDEVYHLDLDGNLLGISAIGAHSGDPTGISQFDQDVFLVSDSGDRAIHEFVLGSTGGAVTYNGTSTFAGFDLSTLTNIESAHYDPATFTLYVLDTPSANTSSVHVFHLAAIPEPGTASLLALGLVGLAARRRDRRHVASGRSSGRCWRRA